MLLCNLSVLLAERNLKITKVSKDTGISRTTLTSLISNTSKGIQFDTLNTLCNYLNVSVGDLFVYSPYEFSVLKIEFGKDNEIFITLDIKQKPFELPPIELACIANYHETIQENLEKSLFALDILIEGVVFPYFFNLLLDLNDRSTGITVYIFNKMHKMFYYELETDIKIKVFKILSEKYKQISENINISISWNDNFFNYPISLVYPIQDECEPL